MKWKTKTNTQRKGIVKELRACHLMFSVFPLSSLRVKHVLNRTKTNKMSKKYLQYTRGKSDCHQPALYMLKPFTRVSLKINYQASTCKVTFGDHFSLPVRYFQWIVTFGTLQNSSCRQADPQGYCLPLPFPFPSPVFKSLPASSSSYPPQESQP